MSALHLYQRFCLQLLVLIFQFDGLLAWSVERRSFLSQVVTSASLLVKHDKQVQVADDATASFRYSDSWTGTNLHLLSLEQASRKSIWEMGRWPDPILRRPASPVDPQWFGSAMMLTACRTLQNTARREGAVGLAAQQCGVDSRIVYLERPRCTLINPRIVQRSSEEEMRCWQEQCLVLPPTFVATVLRDAWVDVQYWTPHGNLQVMRLRGEPARCVQHEMDHDRGILTLDHVGLEEMENDTMRRIEAEGHESRMLLAYRREVEPMALA